MLYSSMYLYSIWVTLRRLEMSKSSVQYDLYIKVLKLRYTKYSTEILKYFYYSSCAPLKHIGEHRMFFFILIE